MYLAEVSRRRRAEHNSVRVWVADNAGTTKIYIANDSHVPIVDTKIMVLHQQSHSPAMVRGGMKWEAVGWIARGPHIVHPSENVVLTIGKFCWKALDKNVPTPTLVRLEYETSAEARAVQFTRLKKRPRRVEIVDVGYLRTYEQEAGYGERRDTKAGETLAGAPKSSTAAPLSARLPSTRPPEEQASVQTVTSSEL
ncbi:hypothetical protein [Micromonospora foliorum]|uniref:hypothetical protein n=1 Tax=Micromonospora foliorum TaxID=2911210 RepID=UPI001EE90D9A|nr:hypothetical protein [Micromonospora foliorum]MCG5440634.1 hypothetical protein [Micromonospora foliorum]